MTENLAGPFLQNKRLCLAGLGGMSACKDRPSEYQCHELESFCESSFVRTWSESTPKAGSMSKSPDLWL